MPLRSALTLALAASAANAGVPDYDFDWATITHPGNEPIVVDNPGSPGSPTRPVGRVDRAYRISRNELTTGQWFEFVLAFAPHQHEVGQPISPDFATSGITFTGYQNGVPQYTLNEARRNKPVGTNWYYGARYANWLHNGKATHRDAFFTGAYDASTWFTDEETHERMEGARFFMPTYDEWAKAVYWDPDRYGEEQPGFWLYPNSSDEPLAPGAPGEGETSLGVGIGSMPYDVGSYPDTQSPWGLLDASGGFPEWLEVGFSFDPARRGYIPSSLSGSLPPPEITDRIGAMGATGASPQYGFRFASVVPAPSGAALLALGLLYCRRKRV